MVQVFTVTGIYHSLHGAPVIHPWRSAAGFDSDGLHPLGRYDAFNWRDVIGQMLCKALIDLGSHPIEPLLRVYNSRGPFDQIVVQGDKPHTTPYDGSLDWKRYGSFLDSAFTAGRVLSGGLPSNFSIGREHNVTHAGLSGDLRVKDTCIPLYNHIGDDQTFNLSLGNLSWTVNLPVFHEFINSPWNVAYSLLQGVNVPLSGWDYNIPHPSAYGDTPVCELRVLLTYIKEHIFNAYSYLAFAYFPWGDYHQSLTNNFEWSERDGVIRISYTTIWSTTHLGGGFVSFDTDIAIPLEVPYLEPLGYEDGISEKTLIPGVLLGTAVRNITAGSSPLIDAWFGVTSRSYAITQDFLWLASGPGNEDYTGSEHPIALLQRKKPWRSHKAAVEAYASDIRYSAFQSTADALDASTSSLRTDIWQTLVKIPEISDQVPDFAAAVSLLKNVVVGRPLDNLSQVIDMVTELRLTHQFEWRPEYDLITSLGPQMIDTLKEVARLSSSRENEVVLRGKFEFDFPAGTFGYPSSHLTTHSRVAVESGGFRYLDGLLSLKATGFAPLASTAWDLTPFSFVANWFTGIGPRIRDLESVALVGVMGIKVLTHSFLIESSPTTREEEAYRINHSGLPGSKDLKWRFFAREVSSHVPPPRVGAFDFRMPTRLPDWATAGSLVWQVFL